MRALESTRQERALVQRGKETNPALVYIAALSESGRRAQRAALERIARLSSSGAMGIETFPWASLRFQHVQAIRVKLAETLSPATVNRYLCAVRGTLRAAWLLGQMTAEQYHKAASVKSVRGDRLPRGRSLSCGELSALMRACASDSSAAGVRDAAIIALLYAGGLRRAELVALQTTDYDATTGELHVRGKGGKERIVWLNDGAADAMRDWLSLRGDAAGALFCAVNKAGRLSGDAMTAQAVYKMLLKRATEAGVKRFSPQDLRRSFVSDLLDAGADIATVAKMAGHANVQTTARYDRRPENAKQKAASLLHVPYIRAGDASLRL